MSKVYSAPDPETARIHAAMVAAGAQTGLFYEDGMMLHLSPSVLYRDCAAGQWLRRFAAAVREGLCDS